MGRFKIAGSPGFGASVLSGVRAVCAFLYLEFQTDTTKNSGNFSFLSLQYSRAKFREVVKVRESTLSRKDEE